MAVHRPVEAEQGAGAREEEGGGGGDLEGEGSREPGRGGREEDWIWHRERGSG